jgi:hypothetical protein
VNTRVTYSHWFPIVTRCPLSWRPDFLFAEVILDQPAAFLDLYEMRKRWFHVPFMRSEIFMEDLARGIMNRVTSTPLMSAKRVTVRLRLAFSKHIVELEKVMYV